MTFQTRKLLSLRCSYLYLSNLINALELNPGLASLPCRNLAKIIQSVLVVYIFILSWTREGCIFQHFLFSMLDLLLDTMLTAYCLTLVKIKGREISWHSSHLSGPSVSYFKKHISAMASLKKNVETPQLLFNSFEESCSKAKHEA